MRELPHVFVNWPSSAWINWQTEELRQGRVRQGWGGVGCNLVDQFGSLRQFEDWVQSYLACSPHAPPEHITDAKNRTRYSILKAMLEAREGDIVVFPHIPGHSQFSTVTVTSGYEFNDSQFELENLEAYCHWLDGSVPGRPRADAGHVIRVDPGSLRTHGYWSSHKTKLVSKRFPFYRRCFNVVRDHGYAQLIREIHTA